MIDREKLRALEAKATPGPLHRCGGGNGHIISNQVHMKVYECAVPVIADYMIGKTMYMTPVDRRGVMDANADLLVESRNSLLPLLDRLDAAEEALRAMLSVHDEECRLDHHGYCQTHSLRDVDGVPECEVAKARAYFDQNGGSRARDGDGDATSSTAVAPTR